MGKIKGWKKVGYAVDGGCWESEMHSNKRIFVDSGYKTWYVIKRVYTPTSGTNDILLAKDKLLTKKQAMAFAMKYMRSHPRG